jgi:hypothetical protein
MSVTALPVKKIGPPAKAPPSVPEKELVKLIGTAEP